MHKKISLLVIVILVTALTALPAWAITWGEPDDNHTNAGAMVVDWPGYGPWQFCSGTLIHPQVVLTAGHCTDAVAEYGIETVWVNFNSYALELDGLRLVEQVITHPDFAWGGNNPHDVGLLVLTEPVYDIMPAPLPYEGFLNDLRKAGELRAGSEGIKFTMVGYGGTLNWPPPDIYYEDIRQMSSSEYVALTKPFLHLNQNIKKGNGGTCFGDSGGPTFYTAADGSEIVVGITSWGDSQCIATGFNYRVDIPETLGFIAEVFIAWGFRE
jgi:secreted trypsin-like serine protease